MQASTNRDIDNISILEDKIKSASQAYYLEEPTMSDQAFDRLVEELRNIDPNHPLLTSVGWGLSVYKDKVSLPKAIRHSLGKVNGYENLKSDFKYRTSLKIDGMTCIVQYVKGQLRLAATRGDGLEGVNITTKALQICDIPRELSSPVDLIVRGELYISLSTFEKHLSETASNPRASVAGIINRKSLDGLPYVNFVVHPESFEGLGEIEASMSDCFHVVPENYLTPEKFDVHYHNNTHYPTDGLVCSGRNLEDIFAFKFETEEVTTTITHVEYNMKKGGKLIPTIHYSPVKLYGTICKKCSGFNYQYIKDNNIGAGTVISITKANEIIPYITEILTGSEPQLPDGEYRTEGVHAYVMGDIQYELSLEAFVMHHYCFDGFKRPKVIIDALNITTFQELSEWSNEMYYSQIVSALNEAGVKAVAEKIADKMTKGALNELGFFKQFGWDGMGEKASEALQTSILEYRNTGFDIDKINAIANEANVNITVKRILCDKKFFDMVVEVRAGFPWEYKNTTPQIQEGEVKGTVIVTGGLPSGITKKQFGEKIAPFGYKMVTTSKQAGIVISSPTSTTAKAKYARVNGLPLLTEDQFYEKYMEG